MGDGPRGKVDRLPAVPRSPSAGPLPIIEEMRRRSAGLSRPRARSAAREVEYAPVLLLRDGAELLEGPILDLPDPLLRDGEDQADLAERERGLAGQAEPEREDFLLAGPERVHEADDRLVAVGDLDA